MVLESISLRLCASAVAAAAIFAVSVAPALAQDAPPGPPPAEQYEAPPPGGPAGEAWIHGHWVWHGRWVWVGGRWSGCYGRGWVPGHYGPRGFWIEGHCRR